MNSVNPLLLIGGAGSRIMLCCIISGGVGCKLDTYKYSTIIIKPLKPHYLSIYAQQEQSVQS